MNKKFSSLQSQLSFISPIQSAYKDLSEIYCNEDGILRVECRGVKYQTDITLSADQRSAIIKTLAGINDRIVNFENPSLVISLPKDMYPGVRFTGLLPPPVEDPVFNLRFPPQKILSLTDLYATGMVNADQVETLSEAVANRKNIFIVGGCSSGKTTLLRALLMLIEPHERVICLEDKREIPAILPDSVTTQYDDASYPLSKAIQETLFRSPNRIIFGEMTTGEGVLSCLKIWSTGHPGGITTLHATDVDSVFTRLYTLMQEVVAVPSRELIKLAVDVIVCCEQIHYETNKFRRKVTAIKMV